MTLGVAATVMLPQGDADDDANTSLGVRATFAYAFTPYVAALASFDYVMVNADRGVVGAGTDLHFHAFDVGARFTLPQPGAVQPFGELLFGPHSYGADSSAGSDSHRDIGYRLGGGAMVLLGGNAKLVAELAYTTATIDHASIESFALEGGVGWAL
jgi:hypothetical protein